MIRRNKKSQRILLLYAATFFLHVLGRHMIILFL